MRILIKKPFALNETGGRSNNEDAVYPSKGTALSDEVLFMVCDGVGGSEKGEVASSLAIRAIRDFFLKDPFSGMHQSYIDSAIDYTQKQFDQYLDIHAEAKGMGTTLTLLYLSASGALLAHIGDSRIYHIRAGKILFQTEDHSLVNTLVKNNIITPEEALAHPQRNVITRAIQGNSVSKVKADVTMITDLRPGDYFFLCSDGILEKVSNDILCSILSQKITNDEKIAEIYNQCFGQTRDNFSAYLVQVERVAVPYDFSRVMKPVSKMVHSNKVLKKNFNPAGIRNIVIAALLSIIAFLVILYFALPAKTPVNEKKHPPKNISPPHGSSPAKPKGATDTKKTTEKPVPVAKPSHTANDGKSSPATKEPQVTPRPTEVEVNTGSTNSITVEVEKIRKNDSSIPDTIPKK